MRGMLTIALAVLCVGGCAQVQQRQIAEETARVNAANSAAFGAINQKCAARLEAAEFNIIRDKVELNKADADTPPPFNMSANTNYPTEVEKAAIAIWGQSRIDCQREANALAQSMTLPPNMKRVQFDKWRSFQVLAGQHVSELVVALHAGKLTYGEFAKKRAEIGREGKTAQREYVEALQIADAQRRMQEAQLAEQRHQNSLIAWAAYMQSVQALQPVTQPVSGTLNLRTNCITQRLGAMSTTNCN